MDQGHWASDCQPHACGWQWWHGLLPPGAAFFRPCRAFHCRPDDLRSWCRLLFRILVWLNDPRCNNVHQNDASNLSYDSYDQDYQPAIPLVTRFRGIVISNLPIISRSMIISRQINFGDTVIIPQQLLILLRPVCRTFSCQMILKRRERSTHLIRPMGNLSV